MVVGGSSLLRHKPSLPNCVTAPQSVLASKPMALNNIQLVSITGTWVCWQYNNTLKYGSDKYKGR
jgi:hypothetical protein